MFIRVLRVLWDLCEKKRGSAEEIAAGLDRAVLVTGFNGGNCNNNSGNFSFGIEGLLIKNGKIDWPVSEMNIHCCPKQHRLYCVSV